jgi:hypothetical protein
MSSHKQVSSREEPEVTQEEDVPVDRKDSEGERLMQDVRNDKLQNKAPTTEESQDD